MNALKKLQNDSRYSVSEWQDGEIQVVEIDDEGTDYSIVVSHNAYSVKLKSRETGYEWEYIPTPKRPITPHKGDESGGRTTQVNAKLTPKTKEQLDQILAASGESLADWLTEKVKENMWVALVEYHSGSGRPDRPYAARLAEWEAEPQTLTFMNSRYFGTFATESEAEEVAFAAIETDESGWTQWAD